MHHNIISSLRERSKYSTYRRHEKCAVIFLVIFSVEVCLNPPSIYICYYVYLLSNKYSSASSVPYTYTT